MNKNLSYQLTTNKALDLDLYLGNPLKRLSFGLSFRFSRKTDHAGISIDFSFLNLSFYLSFYDIRHWNSTTNTYEI